MDIQIGADGLDPSGRVACFNGSDNVRFATLPNIKPSELARANYYPAFVEAVDTKFEAPFEQLMDWLESPMSVANLFVDWGVRVGNPFQI
ncbi:hypothetical protein ACE6H2_026289 [Prunus campanulata]